MLLIYVVREVTIHIYMVFERNIIYPMCTLDIERNMIILLHKREITTRVHEPWKLNEFNIFDCNILLD